MQRLIPLGEKEQKNYYRIHKMIAFKRINIYQNRPHQIAIPTVEEVIGTNKDAPNDIRVHSKKMSIVEK